MGIVFSTPAPLLSGRRCHVAAPVNNNHEIRWCFNTARASNCLKLASHDYPRWSLQYDVLTFEASVRDEAAGGGDIALKADTMPLISF